jgi:nitroreductase
VDIYELIRLRKSVREWSDRAIDPALLTRIIDGARLAPSAKNGQEWHVVAVSDESARRSLGYDCAGQPFVAEAPVVLAVCGDATVGTMKCGIPRMPVDCAILIDHITLIAVAEGLGTCWIGSFDQNGAQAIVGAPDGWEVMQLLPIGYPADPTPQEKRRKAIEDILSWERW